MRNIQQDVDVICTVYTCNKKSITMSWKISSSQDGRAIYLEM